jgi:hypothetical protein
VNVSGCRDANHALMFHTAHVRETRPQ